MSKESELAAATATAATVKAAKEAKDAATAAAAAAAAAAAVPTESAQDVAMAAMNAKFGIEAKVKLHVDVYTVPAKVLAVYKNKGTYEDKDYTSVSLELDAPAKLYAGAFKVESTNEIRVSDGLELILMELGLVSYGRPYSTEDLFRAMRTVSDVKVVITNKVTTLEDGTYRVSNNVRFEQNAELKGAILKSFTLRDEAANKADRTKAMGSMY